MNLRILALRLIQKLSLSLGFSALAYAGGSLTYGQLSQRWQSHQFERKLDEGVTVESKAADVVVDLREGDLIGKLEIPKSGISVMVLHGIAETTLRAGAGHVPATPLPGAEGNFVIAAHRDTFFRKLEGIQPGDPLRVTTTREFSTTWFARRRLSSL